MKIRVKIAMMSHLSDAQELIMIGNGKQALVEINYAKHLIDYYQDQNQEAEDDELTKVCLGELKR